MHKTLPQKTTIKHKIPPSPITVVSLIWLYHSSVSSSFPGAILKKKRKKENRLTVRVTHLYHLGTLDAKGRDQCAKGFDSMWGHVLAGFVLSTWLGLSQRKELQLGKCLHESCCGAFSQLVIKWGGPSSRWCHPWSGGLGFNKKGSWASHGSKPVSTAPPWPLHQRLLPNPFDLQFGLW